MDPFSFIATQYCSVSRDGTCLNHIQPEESECLSFVIEMHPSNKKKDLVSLKASCLCALVSILLNSCLVCGLCMASVSSHDYE